MRENSVTFTLLCEGSSDRGLITLLAKILVSFGATCVMPDVDHRKGSVEEKIARLRDEGMDQDVVFVHRDADNAGPDARSAEILGADPCGYNVIPVIPVTMTEAWLLTEEAPIRAVVGRSGGKESLNLPPTKTLESLADPKKALQQALLNAAGQTGRRASLEERRFNSYRQTLLQQLDHQGTVSKLASFKRLIDDVEQFARKRHWTP